MKMAHVEQGMISNKYPSRQSLKSANSIHDNTGLKKVSLHSYIPECEVKVRLPTYYEPL